MAVLNYRIAKEPIEAVIKLTGGGGVTSVAVLTSLSLVTGSIIYLLFRSLVYDTYVMSWLDAYCDPRQTYRTWIIDVLKKDNIAMNTSKAQHIANIIDNKKMGKAFYTDNIRRAYAGTFLLYLAGILGVITGLLFFFLLKPSWSNQGLHYLKPHAVFVFGIICLWAGFTLDARQSEHGALALRERTPDWEVYRVARRIGLKESTSDIEPKSASSRSTAKPAPNEQTQEFETESTQVK